MLNHLVKETIIKNKLMEENGHIVIGLSGGPDSVCLFHVLLSLQKEFSYNLHAVHINHKFRPGAAEEDQQFVEELCKTHQIPCTVFTYDCARIAKERGITGEEAGRMVRYDSFYQVAEKIRQKDKKVMIKIAVAHNANDQAETLLIRLIRGTGPDGLAGMEYERKDPRGINVIRPLLDVSREEIEKYCEQNNLNPRIDRTNLEPIYTRNKIRLELIPYINEMFKSNVTEALIRLSKISGEDKAFLWEKVYEEKNKAEIMGVENQQERIFDCNKLKNMAPSIRHRLILNVFDEMGLGQDISRVHIEAADKLIENARASASIHFPRGYRLAISYGKLVFKAPSKCVSEYDTEKQFDFTVRTFTIKEWESVEAEKKTDLNNYVIFDFEKIKPYKDNIVLRYREQGDFIKFSENGGSKKLQDFFVDQKVPKEKRKSIPILAIGPEVLFVLGNDGLGVNSLIDFGLSKGRRSGNYKVCNFTSNILLLEFVYLL